MTVNVHINKASVAELKARLTAAREGLQNDSVVMKQVAVYLDSWVQRNFKSKGGSVGGWEAYTYGGRLTTKAKANAKSIAGRRYINTAAAMLQDTGALRISFLPFIRKGVAGIGSDLPYSKPHEEGDPTRSLPQRRMLPVNSEVEDPVLQILDNFVKVQLRKAK